MSMDEQESKAMVGKACSFSCGSKELIAFYDDWVKDNAFEKDIKNLVCVVAENGAKRLDQFLKQHQFGTDCKILDVGSGTGLVGEHLKVLNYTNIDALEPSEKSNDVAKSKGVYKTFFPEFLGPGLQISIPSNTYDAAVCTGVFTLGHVKAEGAMDEMVRVVKPGGLICFSIREDVMFEKEYGYEEKMSKLCEIHAWKLLYKSLEPYFLSGHKFKGYMFVYQVL